MSGLIDPSDNAVEVTPSDTVDLAKPSRGLYVGASGDVKVDMLSGETVTFVALAAGVVHPLQVRRVYSTDTTATDIVAVY